MIAFVLILIQMVGHPIIHRFPVHGAPIHHRGFGK
jgi:hypothetical protein